jgi:glutamate--cysteine ligase
LEREKSPADDLLDHFHGPWGSDLKKVYEEFSY